MYGAAVVVSRVQERRFTRDATNLEARRSNVFCPGRSFRRCLKNMLTGFSASSPKFGRRCPAAVISVLPRGSLNGLLSPR